MPFTPFHLGPSSWLGLALFKVFDLPALLISSVIIDLEPLVILCWGLDLPMHGFLHSFLGGTIVAFLTAVILYRQRETVRKIMARFRMSQHFSFCKILFSALVGAYSHVLLDAFLYAEMHPFYPWRGNPFLGFFSAGQIYAFCSVSLLIGALWYLIGRRRRNLQV